MDVLIDWDSAPWDEGWAEPGFRGKVVRRDGLAVMRLEFTEAFADKDWITMRHLFVFHVVEGESTLRFKDGGLVRVRQGDTGIIAAGEAGAHTVDLAPGERVVIVGFHEA